MQLAQLCQKAENQFVGVNSGLMDQFASAHGKDRHALLFDCRTLDWEAVALPKDVGLVIADTGTRRTLATSHYNERRADCEEAVRILKTVMPDIRALRDVTAEQFNEHSSLLPEQVRMRAVHIIRENARVLAAAEALRQREPVRLGNLMDESHISGRDLYEASGPALDAMWKAAHGHPARLGGRFAGAGWAGCMVFLVYESGCAEFMEYLAHAYRRETGLNPTLYQMQAAEGAQRLQ
jgi:galactokinase